MLRRDYDQIAKLQLYSFETTVLVFLGLFRLPIRNIGRHFRNPYTRCAGRRQELYINNFQLTEMEAIGNAGINMFLAHLLLTFI